MLLFSLLAFFISFGLCLFAKGRFLLAIPNERSAHSIPTSRFGGIAIWMSLVIANTLAFASGVEEAVWLHVILLCVSILGIMGSLDDRKPLPALARLFGQVFFCAVSIYVLEFDFPFTPFHSINMAMGFFLMLAFINAGNFSDGINGLWSGTVLLWIAYLGYFYGYTPLLIFAAAIMGFFVLNFPKGKIFLGDCGSTVIGGIALLYGLDLIKICTDCSFGDGTFLVKLTIVFAPFIFVFADVVMTLLLRIGKGHSPFHPHKEHFKQQLVHKIGLSHGVVTLMYLFGNVLSSFIIGFGAMHGQLWTALILYVPLQFIFFGGVIRLVTLCSVSTTKTR